VLRYTGRGGRLRAQIPGWRVSSLGRQGCHYDADPARGSASLLCSAASANSLTREAAEAVRVVQRLHRGGHGTARPENTPQDSLPVHAKGEVAGRQYLFEDETNGDCSHQSRRIRVSTRLQPAHRVKTLCHEPGHSLLHSEPTDRALAELEAESVAYIVCDGLDIQSDEWTLGYVASWSGGGDEAIAAIKAAGTRIQRTADRILSAVLLDEGDFPEERVSNEEP
jgi:hypothetical protein